MINNSVRTLTDPGKVWMRPQITAVVLMGDAMAKDITNEFEGTDGTSTTGPAS